MPVRTRYHPRPSSARDTATCVSLVRRSTRARRKQVLQFFEAPLGVRDHAGSDADAAGAAGRAALVADEDAALAQSVGQRRGLLADAQQDEVRLARQTADAEAAAEVVDAVARDDRF